jgi:hypothetical protein
MKMLPHFHRSRFWREGVALAAIAVAILLVIHAADLAAWLNDALIAGVLLALLIGVRALVVRERRF